MWLVGWFVCHKVFGMNFFQSEMNEMDDLDQQEVLMKLKVELRMSKYKLKTGIAVKMKLDYVV